jgi:hypothetical protein
MDSVRGGVTAARFRVGRVSRGDQLQALIVIWLVFLAGAAVYALIRPVIRAVFPDVGILISLTDGLDVLFVFLAAVGAVVAIVCTIVIAIRTVRNELPPSAPPPGIPPGLSNRSAGGTTRGRPS